MERERESWQHLVQAEEGSLRSEAARLEWSKGSCAWKGGTSVAPPVGVSFGSGLLELGQRRVLVSQEAAGRGAPGQRPAPVLPWRVHLEECDVTTFSAAGSCGRRVTSAEPLTVPGSWHDGRGGRSPTSNSLTMGAHVTSLRPPNPLANGSAHSARPGSHPVERCCDFLVKLCKQMDTPGG